VLFGSVRQRVLDFGVDTTAVQGAPAGSLLLGAVLLLPLALIVTRLARDRRWPIEYDFCAYLVLTALLSCAGYVLARCGEVGFVLMRYELLSLIGAVALGAWGLRVAPPWARNVWIVLTLAFVGISTAAHGQMLGQYLTRPPVSAKLRLARQLEARGIRYATSDYWIAYAVTFVATEKTRIASRDLVRIREYNRLAEAHPDETVHIAREPCPNGHRVMEGIYFCNE
jgi:hypothetical protein